MAGSSLPLLFPDFAFLNSSADIFACSCWVGPNQQDQASSHPFIFVLGLIAFAIVGLLAIRTMVRWDFPDVHHDKKLSERLD